MNPISRQFLIGLCILFSTVAASVSAQTKADDAKKVEELKADSYRRMNQTISTKGNQEKLPFSKFLESLGKQLSDKKKFTVRLDREAFGKDADEILNEMVVLPEVPSRLTVKTALRLALSQTPSHDFEIEFAAAENVIIITTRDRSLYTANYSIAEVCKHTAYLHAFFVHRAEQGRDQCDSVGYDLKADPAKPDEWIVRQMVASSPEKAGWRNSKAPSSIQVLNGTKLVIHAPPSVHEFVQETLSRLLRLADVAVVMNARIVELDRAMYDKEFAPLFIDPKDKSARLAVFRLNEDTTKKLAKNKTVLTADPMKLRPLEQNAFISFRIAHQYVAGPGDPTQAFGTVYDGVTFAVRPEVSPDGRCLRLELSQEAAQLVKFTKGNIVDFKTGKEVGVDLPNVKNISTKATIEIHDLQPIAMTVAYQPKAKDRVWLLVAEPMVYMEEEQDRIRKEAIPRMLMADEKPMPAEPELPFAEEKAPARPAALQLPDNKDVKEILQAIIESVLTDKEVLDLHDFYGTRGDNKFSLDNNAHAFLWPKNFRPTAAGFTMHQFDPGECSSFRSRLMGIRIDSFGWDPTKPAPKEVHVDIAIHNVGGSVNGGVIGGGHVSYIAARNGNRWVVRWTQIECL